MAVSMSTPRIRLTQFLYVLALLAVALTDGRALEGMAGLAAQAAGFALVVAGTLWRVWASAFIAGRKDAEVVDAGPYARCRHPLYLGSLVAGLGLALSTRSIVLTVALPSILTALLGLAIRREERLLKDQHDEAWLRYRDRVPALWPRSGPVPAVGRREVDLPVYRKAFFDAATMMLLWLLVISLDGLRARGAWEALFALP